MRFVQFSDVHLDSRISRSMRLPDDLCRTLRRDLRTSFGRACDLAVEQSADLVLIAGDLFDYECVDSITGSFLADALASVAPARVFISPGNHDSLRAGSPYTGIEWPPNVHVFKEPSFESVAIPELDCCIVGIAHAHRGIADRLLDRPIDRPDCGRSILVFHGSRESFRPSGKDNVLPFSDEALLAQGFTYTAIGHYHSYSEIRDEGGCVRGAYSGCLQGRALDECGRKVVVIGDIDHAEQVSLRQVEVAERRIVRVDVSVTGHRDLDETCEAVARSMAGAGVRECDVADVVVSGQIAFTLDVERAESALEGRCACARVRAGRLEPEYDLEALAAESAAPSLKSAFVRRMAELERQATDDQRPLLRDAMYYGLYALDGRELEPRDAD